jgi:hypothetical protein
MREHLTVLSHSCVYSKYSPYGDGKENDKMKSYEQKILAWDGADFHELAASMDQEEIRSMARILFDETFDPMFDIASPETVIYNYTSYMAFEAEIADDEDLAYIIYDLMDEMD